MIRIYPIIVSIFLVFSELCAQNLSWADQFSGSQVDRGRAMVTDAAGNVYTTGSFAGTVDFDPGAGVFNLTSFGNTDIFISKLNSAGNFVWAIQMGGTLSDYGFGIVLDPNGNVYTTGSFYSTADFDPGAGVFNLTSAGNNDIFVSKLSSSGTFIWAKCMGGPSANESGTSIALDASGNVFTAGNYQGTSDFDPGAGVFNLTCTGTTDMFVSKLDVSGNFVWAKKIGGSSAGTNVYAGALTIDPLGDVYLTGGFQGTNDFDPGAGTFNMTGALRDIYVLKLDNPGNFAWAKQLVGSGISNGNDITSDASSNLYITGDFRNTVDFDPGAGTFNMTASGTSPDIFILKLNLSGNLIFAKQMGGTGFDHGNAISLDGTGNIYTSGNFDSGIVDFDPGAGTFNLNTVGLLDLYVSKLNSNGNFVWAIAMGGPGNDIMEDISLDLVNNIFITGGFDSTPIDFDPGAGTYTLTATAAVEDAFVAKYCQLPVISGPINGPNNLCSNSGLNTFSISTVSGATSYTWSLPGGWTGSSSTNTISATPGSSGIFTVTASNGCGMSAQQTLSVTVNSAPTISVNSGSICAGQSFTMVPNGANTYTIQGGSAVVSPTASTSYTIVGTSTAGCVSSVAATSNVTVNPTPTANAGSTQTITCSNPTVTLNGSGVTTYTWSGPGIVSGGNSSTPVVNASGTYSLVGSTSGCNSNTAMVVVSSNTVAPSVNANTSNSIICGPPFQGTATLTASGASTYTWNTSATTNTIAVSPSVTTQYTVTGTNAASGCTNTAVFTQSVSTCTALSDLQTPNSEPSVYPNPNNGKFILEATYLGSVIDIYNTLGEKVYTVKITEEKMEIDLGDFSNGIYVIKYGHLIKKIIKN